MSRWLATRTQHFQSSVIQETSQLAAELGALNLAEGFPDFPAPVHIKDAGVAAIEGDCNQYSHVVELCNRIGEAFTRNQGVPVDPDQEVTICCGQTEGFAAAALAVVNPGEEVVLFEPVYETYAAAVQLAGGVPKYVKLGPPLWAVQETDIAAAIGPACKAIVVNSPHNPTGKVFTRQELESIAKLCKAHDLLAITDEVYEHFVYDGGMHVSLAALPGMKERTIVTSSMSKTFCVTGWRIGWAIAPPALSAAISNIHVKLTDSAPAPFQHAAVVALRSGPDYFKTLRKEFEERRDLLCSALSRVGFKFAQKPAGGFFLFAEVPKDMNPQLSDVAFVSLMIRETGVAVVPGCAFQGFQPINERASSNMDHDQGQACASTMPELSGSTTMALEHTQDGTRYIRVAFCKDIAKIKSASDAMLARWARPNSSNAQP